MLKTSISRRNFIKFLTAAGVGTSMATAGLTSFAEWSEAATEELSVLKNTLCNACGNRCAAIVELKNGRIWRATGNPACPEAQGTLCARGNALLAQPYAPDRLSQPMKRVGDKFEAIPWDQAYQEIGEKLKAIIAKAGPESVFYAHHPKPTADFYFPRFLDAIGSPNLHSHHVMCTISRDVGMIQTVGLIPQPDLANSRYIIIIGRAYGDGVQQGRLKALLKAKEHGAKFIMVDPRYNSTSHFADEWLPIKPGTDLALLLAMANVIIKENLYDRVFVMENAVGFGQFAETMKEYTPDWAAKITDISAGTIARIAREFASAKPRALIDPSWKGAFGSNYANSTETARMVALVNALIGNYNQTGGMSIPRGVPFGALDPNKYPSPPPATAKRLDECGPGGKYPFTPLSKGVLQLVLKKSKEGRPVAGIIKQFNPAQTFNDREFIKQSLQSLELLVVVDYRMSETAELAHYVLPELTYLERTDIVEGKINVAEYAGKVIEPVLQGPKPLPEIVAGIAKAMGLGQYFNFTLEELNEARMLPTGVGYAELKEKGAIPVQLSPVIGFPKLKTSTGKVQFANEDYVKAGFSAVPKWNPPAVVPDAKKDPHEFRLIWGKQSWHSHSSTLNIPSLNQITKDYDATRLWMSKSRADALGIKDKELVTVENAKGKGTIRVKVTEGLHPEAVFLPSHYGAKAASVPFKEGISMVDFGEYREEAISGSMCNLEIIVRVSKA